VRIFIQANRSFTIYLREKAMKSGIFINLSLFALLAFFLVACNLPIGGEPTPDPGLVFTQAAQTSAVLPTNPPSTVPPTVIITQVSPTLPVATPTATPTTAPTSTPTMTATPAGGICSDQIEFVSDVTIPDDTELLVAEEFVKTWRLKNTGTCTWTNAYALVFINGDQLSGTSPSPLTGSTAPGAMLDVSVSMKAPGTTGNYKGNWELRNPGGINFGTGKNSDQPFYVQIKVVEGVSELNLGAPTWRDPMDNATNWYLLDTANTKFSMDDGKLVMKSIKPGAGEEWGLSNRPSMNDYYLQATFITGEACSGLDRYGLLGRAPDPNKGYVLEFSCDGRYRLYKWDGTTYTALQEWRSAGSIKSGANQTNVMGLWMQENELRVYANAHLLAEFSDDTYDKGQFGLAVGSANTENFIASVDLVEYWEFDQ
jgi:hypothetical protein